MKIAKTIFTLAAAGTLFAGTALAEPFSQQSTLGFPAETQGIAHVDIDALNASEIGKILREQLEKNLPKITNENKQKLAKILLEFSPKTTSITIGNLGEGQAIFYVRGNVKLEEILEQTTGAKFGKQKKAILKEFAWQIPPNHEVIVRQIDAKTIAIVCAKTYEDAKNLMSQLLKNRENQMTAKINFKIPESSLAFANWTIPESKKMKFSDFPERIFANLVEDAEAVKLSVAIEYCCEELAEILQEDIKESVDYAPMLLIENSGLSSSRLAEICQKAGSGGKVWQEGNFINISAKLSRETLKMLTAPASVPAADDVFGD